MAAQSPGEGQGATFTVKLPVTIAEIAAPSITRAHPTAASMERPELGVRLDGLRVLVVDDDADALDLASAILIEAGAAVRVCSSAPEALEMLRQWAPDVLVADIEMPEEDGYSLIRKVRALDAERGGRTPAVALSAYGRTQDRMRSLTAGSSTSEDTSPGGWLSPPGGKPGVDPDVGQPVGVGIELSRNVFETDPLEPLHLFADGAVQRLKVRALHPVDPGELTTIIASVGGRPRSA